MLWSTAVMNILLFFGAGIPALKGLSGIEETASLYHVIFIYPVVCHRQNGSLRSDLIRQGVGLPCMLCNFDVAKHCLFSDTNGPPQHP